MIIDDERNRADLTVTPDDGTAENVAGDVVSTCPDCGMTLVRPDTFSADRLLHLHRKWGACFPRGATDGEGAGTTDSPVLHVDGVARQGRRPA